MKSDPVVIRWYRLILRLYPRSLRSEYGEEMVEVVQRGWLQARGGSFGWRLAFLLRTWSEAVVQGAGAWIERGLPRVTVPDIFGELRMTVRSLRRSPGFTLTAVLTLALGIGLNTAIFGIVEAVLLDPLPYPDSDRLVGMAEQPWTPTEITLDLRRSADAFEEIAGLYPRQFTVTGGEQPIELEGAAVTTNFFRVLGARMARGRGFTEADTAPRVRIVIISHGVWQRRYGGAEEVLGQTLAIDGALHEIVGVVERGFRQLAQRSDDPQLWIPLELRPTEPDGAYNWEIPIGRLNAGIPLRRAQAELDLVMARFLKRHPGVEGPRWNLRLATLKSTLVGDVRQGLLILQVAVGVVLLLACVNVANLLLARSSSRQRDLAVRSAMGASAGQLLRHLLSESLVLSLLGGGAAVVLMFVGLDLLVAMAPQDTPRIGDVSIDGSVLLFTLAVSAVTGLLFGVVPAMVTTHRGPYEVLKGGGRGVTGSRREHRVSQGLVVAEVTLTLVLLVGAGLLMQSFATLTGQDPGFRTDDVVAVSLHLSEDRYESVPRLEDFYRRVRERIAQLPGVEAVAVSNYLPISMGATREYVVGDRGESEVAEAQYGVVSPGFFQVLDIPLLQGRTFEETDRRGEPGVAIIDEAMWRETWPGQNPIGKRLRFSGEDSWLTVVGLVGDIRGRGLARDPRPGFYVSYQQRLPTPVELAVGRSAVTLVRSRIGAQSLADALRRAIWEVDPQQPVPEIATLDSIVAEGVSPQRFRALLLGSFAGIALLMAVAGIYGVVAYLVAERMREFGVRLAMGATPRDIVGWVLGWGLRLATLGVGLGLIGILAVNHFLSSLLFEISPTDPPTIMASVAAIILVTLTACLVPAFRAMRVDPVICLRTER